MQKFSNFRLHQHYMKIVDSCINVGISYNALIRCIDDIKIM